MGDLSAYFEMLSECNLILLKSNKERELAQGICNTIVNIGHFDSAFMGLLKDNKLDLEVTTGILKQYTSKIVIRLDDERFSSGASGRALKDGKTHIYNDVTHEKDYDAYKDIINETGLKSNLAVPIIVNGKIIGTLGIYSKNAGIFGKTEERLFEELANDIAYGIEKMRSKKHEDKLIDILRKIRNANQRIAKSEDIQSLLDGVCKDLISQNYHMVSIVENGKVHCEGECCARFKENFDLISKKCGEDLKPIDYICQIHPNAKVFCMDIKSGENTFGTFFVCAEPELFEDPEELDLLKEVINDLGVGIDRINHTQEALRFTHIIDNLSEEVYAYDPETFKIRFASKAMSEKLRYTEEEIKRLTVPDISPMYDRQKLSELLKPLLNGEVDNIKTEAVRKTKDGKVYPVDISLSCYKSKDIHLVTAIAMDVTERKAHEIQMEEITDALVKSLSDLVEMKDPYTAGHQKRVSSLAVRIAEKMKLDKELIKQIKIAGLLHDIGKIRVPSDILTKPSKLRKIEYELIKEHSNDGYEILKSIPSFEDISIMVLEHHERIDGSGYPKGLVSKEISLGGRILAVADVVEAMISYRPYRPALGIDAALNEIKANAGRLYDKNVVEACLKVFEEGFKFD